MALKLFLDKSPSGRWLVMENTKPQRRERIFKMKKEQLANINCWNQISRLRFAWVSAQGWYSDEWRVGERAWTAVQRDKDEYLKKKSRRCWSQSAKAEDSDNWSAWGKLADEAISPNRAELKQSWCSRRRNFENLIKGEIKMAVVKRLSKSRKQC